MLTGDSDDSFVFLSPGAECYIDLYDPWRRRECCCVEAVCTWACLSALPAPAESPGQGADRAAGSHWELYQSRLRALHFSEMKKERRHFSHYC